MNQEPKLLIGWDQLSYNKKTHTITIGNRNESKFGYTPEKFIELFEIISPKTISLKYAMMKTLQRNETYKGKKQPHLKMTLLIPSKNLTEKEIDSLFMNNGTNISVNFEYLPYKKEIKV